MFLEQSVQAMKKAKQELFFSDKSLKKRLIRTSTELRSLEKEENDEASSVRKGDQRRVVSEIEGRKKEGRALNQKSTDKGSFIDDQFKFTRAGRNEQKEQRKEKRSFRNEIRIK